MGCGGKGEKNIHICKEYDQKKKIYNNSLETFLLLVFLLLIDVEREEIEDSDCFHLSLSRSPSLSVLPHFFAYV
jgi:hypothetical protein